MSPPVPFCHIRLAVALSLYTCATKTYTLLTDTSTISIPFPTSSISNSVLDASSATLWTPGRPLAPRYASPKGPFLTSTPGPQRLLPKATPRSREGSSGSNALVTRRYCRSAPLHHPALTDTDLSKSFPSFASGHPAGPCRRPPRPHLGPSTIEWVATPRCETTPRCDSHDGECSTHYCSGHRWEDGQAGRMAGAVGWRRRLPRGNGKPNGRQVITTR